jgi:hypothetical protein
MADNYRSGGGFKFSACFVMIFATSGKKPAKTGGNREFFFLKK